MGATQHRYLQEIGPVIRSTFAAILAIVIVMGEAHAQIRPFQGTLTYSRSSETWPRATVKAVNGSAAYVLSLQPSEDIKGNLVHIDLVMHRPGAPPEATNLLSPSYRWHGLQEYDFNASDFVNGPDKSIFGATRTLHIKRRDIVVKFHVAKVDVTPVGGSTRADPNYIFNELVLDVDVDNAK